MDPVNKDNRVNNRITYAHIYHIYINHYLHTLKKKKHCNKDLNNDNSRKFYRLQSKRLKNAQGDKRPP